MALGRDVHSCLVTVGTVGRAQLPIFGHCARSDVNGLDGSHQLVWAVEAGGRSEVRPRGGLLRGHVQRDMAQIRCNAAARQAQTPASRQNTAKPPPPPGVSLRSTDVSAFFCEALTEAMDGERAGAAARRRDRRLQAWHRHVKQTVAMELATALHHSAQPAGPVVAGPSEGKEHETNYARRRQKAPSPGLFGS